MQLFYTISLQFRNICLVRENDIGKRQASVVENNRRFGLLLIDFAASTGGDAWIHLTILLVPLTLLVAAGGETLMNPARLGTEQR